MSEIEFENLEELQVETLESNEPNESNEPDEANRANEASEAAPVDKGNAQSTITTKNLSLKKRGKSGINRE